MLLQILKALIPKTGEWFMWLGFFAPLLAVLIAVWVEEKRRNEKESPPQEGKLLRPPGYSCGCKFDESVFGCMWRLVATCGLGGVCAGLGNVTTEMLAAAVPLKWVAIPTVLTLIAAGATVWFVRRTLRSFVQAWNYRLGLRGEQAVAEALCEVADCGYRAFHDLPGGNDWNIDHVVAGPRGVFVVETKARRRRPGRGKQPAHVVRYDSESLHFPSGDDTKALKQAKMNARWVADYLTTKTGERVSADPLVVLPGWFVERLTADTGGVVAMNATFLTGHLRRQQAKIAPAQVRRIIAALDEKCRDIEF